MSDLVLASGRQISRDLSSVGTNARYGRVAAVEFAALRLVGHKVLAQGAGRSSAAPTVSAGAPGSLVPVSGGAYATRAIASFSQQLVDYGMAKGTRIDTYA